LNGGLPLFGCVAQVLVLGFGSAARALATSISPSIAAIARFRTITADSIPSPVVVWRLGVRGADWPDERV
jgi:hypothetical protein